MSLLPDIERELLRVARQVERETASQTTTWEPRRPFVRIWRLAGSVFSLSIALAAVAVGAAFLFGLHPRDNPHSHLSPSSPATTYASGPQTQPGRWEGAGMACPLAPATRYLPARSGCVSVLHADVTGDGQTDLVLLYARLTHTRIGQLYVPRSFTLEVVRPDGAIIKTRVRSPQANPALLAEGNVNGQPGAEVFVLVGQLSSGSGAYVYTLHDDHLVHANLTLDYGGDSGQKAGFTCVPGHPPTIVQHTFVLEGPGENGIWQRTDTVYAWHGAMVRVIAHHTSEHRGLPPLGATGIAVGCGKLTGSA